MPSRQQILLVSRSNDAAEPIQNCFSSAPDIEVKKRIVTNGQTDPLSGVASFPDLLLLRVAPDSLQDLEALARYTPDERPPLIVIGDTSDAQSMRVAMQAGARDFLAEPIVQDDLLAAVMHLGIAD